MADRPTITEERALLVSNEMLMERLAIMRLESPLIAASLLPGQFIHLLMPHASEHVLRRPFSVYRTDAKAGTLDILYQAVGSVSSAMRDLRPSDCDGISLIGPVGNTWSPCNKEGGPATHVLLVGGGVGAAPLFMLAQRLAADGTAVDVVLGAQTDAALATRDAYAQVLGREPRCATDDGSYGYAGFCTGPVQEILEESAPSDLPIDYVAVCGPYPLQKAIKGLVEPYGIAMEVSLEKSMACGIGACLSCVVDTTEGRRRCCVDGPIFNADKVVW